MKLAIVGTSHLSEGEELDARKRVVYLIRKEKEETEKCYALGHLVDGLEIITGDAKGIDSIVREITLQEKVELKVWKALDNKWEGKYGFKERNKAIAEEADKVISITTRIKSQKCYHCNQEHQRTGGCWTLKYALKLGKGGEVIVI